MSIPAVLRVKSIHFEPVRASIRVLQFLHLAPIIVGEHYQVWVTLENLTERTLTSLTMECAINVRLSNGASSFATELNIGTIVGKNVIVVCPFPTILMREPSTEDFVIKRVYSLVREGLLEPLPIRYPPVSSITYSYVYTVESRSAVYSRILNLLLFIFAAISAYGVFVHH